MTVVLDPRQETRDGHHGHLIEAAMQAVCGETWDRPESEWRQASERLMVGPGTLVTPPGGWTLRSIRELDIDFDHTVIVGRGDIPSVFEIDGCPYGRITGTPIFQGERSNGGGRLDVPRDIVVIHMVKGLQQTHFEIRGRIGGLWRDAGYRGGSVGWTGAQEDHFKSPELNVMGGTTFDVTFPGEADLCRYGVVVGNEAWSNNRRHKFGFLHVAYCETAVKTTRSAIDVDYLVADACRDVLQFGAAAIRVVIRGGEAESCARLVNDVAWQGHDQSLTIRDFYAKLGAWRPGLGGVDTQYQDSAFGVWGTRGSLYLQNVAFDLPVTRGMNGKLYYATHEGGTVATDVLAPRFVTTQPLANIFMSGGCSARGYKRSEFAAFNADGHGACRYEVGGWKDTDEWSIVTQCPMAALNARD
jgi:hypothetical protein